MSTFQKILRWALVVFFAAAVIVYFPNVASILFLLCTLLSLPVKPVADLLAKCKLRGWRKGVAIAAIFMIGALLAPAAAPSAPAKEPPSAASLQTPAQSDTESEELPAPVLEEDVRLDEEVPAENATDEPEQAPAEEAAQTQAPDTADKPADAPTQPPAESQQLPAEGQTVPLSPTSEPEAASEPEPEPTPEPEPASEPEPVPAFDPEPAPDPAPVPAEVQSRTVYVTPTGKRYHYDNHCNGGSYSESTLDSALARGLTPCKKCVGE